MNQIQPLLDAFRGKQLKATLILLLATPLLMFWKYYATPASFDAYFSIIASSHRETGALSHFLCTLVLLGCVPALIVVFVFRERLRDYGVGIGIGRRTLNTALGLVPLFAVLGYMSASDPGLRAKFPMNPVAGVSAGSFMLHIAAYLCYYAGYEFFFRGFLLVGLRETTGDANAVLIQTLASTLAHIGSPSSEAFGAIIGGLLWGVLALRNRSLLSGMLQHYALGVALDVGICFG